MKAYYFVTLCALSVFTVISGDLSDDFIAYLLGGYKSHPKCPLNEVYKMCVRNCSTCEERGNCMADCSIKGCDCSNHHYRAEPGGPCQHVSMCPKPKCGKNEVYRDCGPLCDDCSDNRCRFIQCGYRCYCKADFRRDENGVCIPENECPKKNCTETEVWAEEGPVEEYCLQSEDYVSDNSTQEKEKCYCADHHKRNEMGVCMEETYCSRLGCFGFEKYYDCIPTCNTTCRTYGNPDCVEDGNCHPGCFCIAGYAMNDFRRCVPIAECPTDSDSIVTSTEAHTEATVESSSASSASTTSAPTASASTTSAPTASASTTSAPTASASTTSASTTSASTAFVYTTAEGETIALDDENEKSEDKYDPESSDGDMTTSMGDQLSSSDEEAYAEASSVVSSSDQDKTKDVKAGNYSSITQSTKNDKEDSINIKKDRVSKSSKASKSAGASNPRKSQKGTAPKDSENEK